MKSKVLKLLATGVMAVALAASFGAFTTFAETVKASGNLDGDVIGWKYYADKDKTQEITDEEYWEDPYNSNYTSEKVIEKSCKWTLYNSGRLDITLNSGYKSGTIADFSKVTDVPWYQYRSSVTSVNVAEGVTSIGKWTFGSLENCKSATLPSTIDTIPVSCFSGSGLTTFTMPQNIKKIALYAFKGCTSLSSVTFDENLTEIDTNAFENSGLVNLDFTSGITTIGNNAFLGCTELKSVNIPNIESFGVYVFSGCTSLETVTFDEGITALQDSTFFGCTSLKSIALPENLKTIGNGTFNSSGLEYIILPESLEYIGYSAFASTDLEAVYLQSPISTLTEGTFSNENNIINFYVERTSELKNVIYPYIRGIEKDNGARFSVKDLGDIDGNSSWNDMDISHALRYVTTAESDDIVDKYALDMNLDGNRDMVDVIALYNYIRQ